MKVILLILVVTFVAGANSTWLVNDPKYCYSTDEVRPQLGMFSTTTPYSAVKGLLSVYKLDPPFCKETRLWLVARHGSRYPSIADGDTLLSLNDSIQAKIIKNYNDGKTTLCKSDAENIKAWKMDPVMLQTNGPADLSATGREELINMARSYRAAFPDLLPTTYSQEHYFFRRSPLLRTLQTADAFAEGLFGSGNFPQVNVTGGSYPDLFMYSFGTCTAWAQLFSSGMGQVQAFADRPRFQQMITEVSSKLGFSGSERLNQTQIVALMTHCQYEQILNHQKASPFCSAFSPANVQVYEYYKDLAFYFISGYGNTANKTLFKNMACYLVQDMINFLQASDNQKAKLSFGHDITVQFLMVALGLFDDYLPLTADNFEFQYFRQWRTSLITPMAANFAAVRYDCFFGEDKVLFLLNEKPLQFPGCFPSGFCEISTILNRLSYFANGNCAKLYCHN